MNFKYYLNKIMEFRLVRTSKLHILFESNALRRLIIKYKIDCILDVGANNGQYAKMLRGKVGYRGLIISFEPIPELAAKIKEMANGDDLWFIEECALSNHIGSQEMHVMKDDQFSSLADPLHSDTRIFTDSNRVVNVITVKTETLESAFRRIKAQHKFNAPFLKMDTQGYDVQIVQSGISVLQSFIGIQSELAIKKLYDTAVDFRDAINIYENLGFTLSSFIPNNAGHFPILVETDCIMIRNDLVNTTQ